MENLIWKNNIWDSKCLVDRTKKLLKNSELVVNNSKNRLFKIIENTNIIKQLNSKLIETSKFNQKWHFSKCYYLWDYIFKNFSNNNLNNEELNNLYLGFLEYREGLKSLNINIPKSIFSEKINDSMSILFVDERISDWVHIDFEDKLLKFNTTEENVLINNLNTIIETLLIFWSMPDNSIKKNIWLLKYWVDFKPGNIAFNKNNKLYLLDLFVPKVRLSNWEILYVENIHQLNKLTLEYIHFHKVWILYWFYYKTKQISYNNEKLLLILPILKNKIEQAIIKIWLPNSHLYIENLDTNYKKLPENILHYKKL